MNHAVNHEVRDYNYCLTHLSRPVHVPALYTELETGSKDAVCRGAPGVERVRVVRRKNVVCGRWLARRSQQVRDDDETLISRR